MVKPIMTFACSEYKICLDGIRFRGRHGVSDSERDLPQDFLVTVEVSLPVAVLPHGDHLREVFDYDRVASLVVDVGTRETCRLLETLAQRVIERVLSDTPATRVSVSVTKSRPPTASSVDSVAVELVASRSALRRSWSVARRVRCSSSITRFIEAKFGLPAMTRRDANAATPMAMFDFEHPAFLTPPTIDAHTVVDPAVLSKCNQKLAPLTCNAK